MKLSEYIKYLQELKKEHGNVEVIYAADDEGNGYQKVFYKPTAGVFKERGPLGQGNFETPNMTDEKINVVCVN